MNQRSTTSRLWRQQTGMYTGKWGLPINKYGMNAFFFSLTERKCAVTPKYKCNFLWVKSGTVQTYCKSISWMSACWNMCFYYNNGRNRGNTRCLNVTIKEHYCFLFSVMSGKRNVSSEHNVKEDTATGREWRDEIRRAWQPEIRKWANTYRQTLPSQCCKVQRRRRQQSERGRETSEHTCSQKGNRWRKCFCSVMMS